MAFILLLCLQLGQLMPPPGPPPPPGAPKPEVPALSFTAQFVDNNSAMELTWANTGRSGLYLQLGTILGRQVQMNVKFWREGGGQVRNDSEPGVITGTLPPFVVFLPSGGRFVHRIPSALLYDVAARRPVAGVSGENVTVVASFTHLPATQPVNSALEYAAAGIWTGRATAKASIVRPSGARK